MTWMRMRDFFILLLMSLELSSYAEGKRSVSQAPKDCRLWFQNANIKLGESCPLKCSMIASDMATFDCSRFCDELCSTSSDSEESDAGLKISALYPGLTDEERKFVDKNPKIAIHAYALSWRAEGICKTVYFVSDTNDESDACRHFVWAALLNAKFGTKLSTDLLDAHEQNPNQSEEEKSMDLANNRRGIIVSSELIKNKKTDDATILRSFLADLADGKVVVLKRRKK